MADAPPRRPVLVVGATGNVGGAVVRSLVAAGRPVRAAGRTVAGVLRALDDVAGSGLVEPVALDLTDPATFEPAVQGAGALFLVRPPAISRVGPTLNALVDAAVAAGTGHVVFASVTGADTNRVVPHHRVETHLAQITVPWTILRPGFFAQNLADAYRDDVVGSDRIVLPAGRGRAAFIDVRDLGDVVVRVLGDPARHAGQGYTLTGPRALDFDEVAAVLSAQLGRSVRYEAVGIVAYLRHLRAPRPPSGARMPWVQAVVQTVLHAGLRRGDAETVDPTLEALLGRAPRTLETYVRDHLSTWATPAVAG